MVKREIVSLTPDTKISLTKVKGELEKEQGKIFSFDSVIMVLIDSFNKQVGCREVGVEKNNTK